MAETKKSSKHGARYNAAENREYTPEEIRQQNALYQQRCRKRKRLKALGVEVDKYLVELRKKVPVQEYRKLRLRKLVCLKLPYSWKDDALYRAMKALTELKRELIERLYGKGVPEPSPLASKLMNEWQDSEDSLGNKLDAVQLLLEYVGKQLELMPVEKLPLNQALLSCALAYKLSSLPAEKFAPAFKERLARIFPQQTYRLVMGGDDNQKLDAMANMFADVSKDDAEIDEDDMIELGGIMDHL